jgi:ABC-type cobalamin/Fe3+-siderophores transport system ATPase subunit
MENDTSVLKMEGLSIGYGPRTILKDVNLEVRSGEFWFLLGPNGVGKTSLLRVLLGMAQPQRGHLSLHPEFGNRSLLGFVPQRCDLNPTLPTTVSEFVLLGLAGIGIGKAEESERLSWALEKMNLEEMRRRSYWSLSGGQRQRALVSRALVRRPKLLILDEPTKDLDLPSTYGLMESLQSLNRKEKLTVLFVTHDLTLAVRYCTHTALFGNGTLQTGVCRLVLNSEDLERAYGVPIVIGKEPAGALNVRIDRMEGMP